MMTVSTFITLFSPFLDYFSLYHLRISLSASNSTLCVWQGRPVDDISRIDCGRELHNQSKSALKVGFLDRDSQPHILICATLWWPSSARLAMAFLRHGANVYAVCPPGHPLRFVRGISSIHPYEGLGSIGLLRDAIRAARPTLVVPCDDIAVWQLHALHESEADLRPLIELSLGAAEAYPPIEQRAEFLRVAQSQGIRVPFTQILHSAEELEDWRFDQPAVLKLDGTWGGEGVTIVRSRTEAIQSLSRRSQNIEGVDCMEAVPGQSPFFCFVGLAETNDLANDDPGIYPWPAGNHHVCLLARRGPGFQYR